MRCYYCDESLQPGRHKCWSTGLSFDVGASGVQVAVPFAPPTSFRGEKLVAGEACNNTTDAWSEIVGSSQENYKFTSEMLGELLAKSPEFRQYAEKCAALSRPIVARSPNKTRLWQLEFGPVAGEEGEEKAIEVRPSSLFRGEKILATDTGRVPGKGTRLLSLRVGERSQFRGSEPFSLDAFGNNSLGSGIKFDVCTPPSPITMVVKFVESCTFDATIFGRVAL